jgi:type IV pilus assembly protein PilA
LRQRISDERGFTLIELLVVVLIIGVLAEVAIPSFLGQAPKADDAAAKSAARTAQTAMETYRTDHSDPCAARVADLVSIEPTLSQANALSLVSCPGGDQTAYGISVTSRSSLGTIYTLSVARGVAKRTCSTPGEGGCSTTGSW